MITHFVLVVPYLISQNVPFPSSDCFSHVDSFVIQCGFYRWVSSGSVASGRQFTGISDTLCLSKELIFLFKTCFPWKCVRLQGNCCMSVRMLPGLHALWFVTNSKCVGAGVNEVGEQWGTAAVLQGLIGHIVSSPLTARSREGQRQRDRQWESYSESESAFVCLIRKEGVENKEHSII